MKHHIALRSSTEQRKYLRRLKGMDECGFFATRSGHDRRGEHVDRVWSWRTSYMYAWSRLRNHADAEDVTQSAYLDWSTRSYVIPARYSVNRAIGRLIRSRNADLAKIKRTADLAETRQQITAITVPMAEIVEHVASLIRHCTEAEQTHLKAVYRASGNVARAASDLGIHAARIWETIAAVRQRLA